MAIEYLSPSSYHLYLRNEKEFFLAYVARKRSGPTEPMMIGTAFDVFIKEYLRKCLFGTKPDLSDLDKQEIPQSVRDKASVVFQAYINQGAFTALMKELEQSISPPKFEFTLHNTVNGVPLKGKPDLYFTTKDGVLVIYDWKVNGYMSASTTSPTKGYVWLYEPDGKAGKAHKDCIIKECSGIKCNVDYFDPYWANQLCIYKWLLGDPVGSEQHVIGVDQLVCNPPKIRVAKHRSVIRRDYQLALHHDLVRVWREVQTRTWDEDYERIRAAYDRAGDDAFARYVQETSRAGF